MFIVLMLFTALIICLCQFANFKTIHANAKNSTWYQSLACEDTVKGDCWCLPRPWDNFADLTFD